MPSTSFGAGRFPIETQAPIVVRSPTSGLDDIVVDGANLGWTVEDLKGHLSAAHPAKPAINEQKLVYSGRMLQDHLKLRDVLRQFEPGQTSFMHLVVTGGAFERTVAMRQQQGHGPIGRTVSAGDAESFRAAPPPPPLPHNNNTLPNTSSILLQQCLPHRRRHTRIAQLGCDNGGQRHHHLDPP